MIRQDNRIEEAVNKVKQLHKDNGWPFSFCLDKVSKWYQIDYYYLMSRCNGKNRKNNKIKRKFKKTSEYYGNKVPYWIN